MSIISDLPIEAKLQLNLEDTACRIEYEFSDYLLPAPKGIYVINKVEPVMVDGVEYYTIECVNGNLKRTIVNDVTEIKSSIYTAATGNDKISIGCDKVVIPKAFMLNKEKYIGLTPVMPYRGIKILDGLVNHQVDSFVKYRKSSRNEMTLVKNNFVKLPRETLVIATSRINEIYEDLHTTIRTFMGVHDWHLYFLRLVDAKMTIEKSIDYRAYQWICHEAKLKEKRN